MKKLTLLSALFILGLSSCSKAHFETITKDIEIQLLANETYEFTLPMENTDDNYTISTLSTIAQRNEVISNTFYYTAPATFTVGTTDLVVTTNDHNSGKSGHHVGHEDSGSADQHYIVNFHIKLVANKTK